MSPRKLKKLDKHWNSRKWEHKNAGGSKRCSALIMFDSKENRQTRLIWKEAFLE